MIGSSGVEFLGGHLLSTPGLLGVPGAVLRVLCLNDDAQLGLKFQMLSEEVSGKCARALLVLETSMMLQFTNGHGRLSCAPSLM
jgi:hypothetical protein